MLAYLILWVQVLSEMLPISSSSQVEILLQLVAASFAHVTQNIPKGFDWFLHVPLLIVLPIFFRKSWWGLVKKLSVRLTCQNKLRTWSTLAAFRIIGVLLGVILLSSLLAVCCEFVVKYFDGMLRFRPLGLLLTAFLLFATAKKKQSFVVKNYPYLVLIFIGIIQAIALLPGISRMGATICVALLCGMTTKRAFEWSFALQYPLVLAAVLFRGIPWLVSQEGLLFVQSSMLIHLLAAGIVSYGCLLWATKIFEQRRSWIFGAYVGFCATIFMLFYK